MGYLAFGRDEVGEKALLYFGRGEVDVVFGVVVVVLPASVVEVVVLLLVCVGCEVPFLSFFLILILPLARKSSQIIQSKQTEAKSSGLAQNRDFTDHQNSISCLQGTPI